MFRCNHHHQGARYLSLLKLHLLKQPWLISKSMHKILVYLHIIHLLKSSTCSKHYPAHLQEVYVVIVYMQPLVSSLCKSELSEIIVL